MSFSRRLRKVNKNEELSFESLIPLNACKGTKKNRCLQVFLNIFFDFHEISLKILSLSMFSLSLFWFNAYCFPLMPDLLAGCSPSEVLLACIIHKIPTATSN